MSTVLEAKNINKIIKLDDQKLQILDNISLSVESEDFVSILGPSGSGKSTLLHILGLLDTPTSGEVIISDENVLGLKNRKLSEIRRKKLGYVFRTDNLIPTLSLEDNILLPLYFDKKKSSDYKDKLTAIFEKVGLSHKRKAKLSELTEGERQRASIARSLINDPEIILLDEPTGNIDSNDGRIVMELLQQINKYDKKTIVQVTHEKENTRYSNKIYNIKDGKIAGREDHK